MATATTTDSTTRKHDVVIVGAGFAGLYMLHKMRELGFDARIVEQGDGVGGTWYWNRYPGARCDVQSVEYSYSFSDEIQQEWTWTELMPSQPEILRYANFVADKLALRDGIDFETKVTRMDWDDATARWTVQTEPGRTYVAQHVVAATGCLSVPLKPDIKGMDDFGGDTLFTNQFPKEGYDFSGKRVAVIGTGSSGVQAIPVVAEQAKTLTVFQRSAAYTRPANNRMLEPGEMDEAKKAYPEMRKAQKEAFAGVLRFGAVAMDGEPPERKILETPKEERLKVVDELGWMAPQAWADVATNLDANRAGTELYGEMVKRSVKDPETAAALVPDYPMGCKRQIIDTNYFETFNQPHVKLVDLKKGGIKQVTATGIETEQGDFEFDVILYATGFDAMTGALKNMNITGKGGKHLGEFWTKEGPRSYLGLAVNGFPNLYTITGPGSPSVLSNMIVSIEQHVEWVARCIADLRERGVDTIEATEDAQETWVEHGASLVQGAISTSDSCNSWYLGANVPGKVRVYMPYVGGLPTYREKCEAVRDGGYEGFTLGKAAVPA